VRATSDTRWPCGFAAAGHEVMLSDAIYFKRLLEESRPDLPADERLAISVAGDDATAKQTVLDLIDEIGFTGVDGRPSRWPVCRR
jgi:8-hydroxy-5-deazaflavin:NADPH oxidoreductase